MSIALKQNIICALEIKELHIELGDTYALCAVQARIHPMAKYANNNSHISFSFPLSSLLTQQINKELAEFAQHTIDEYNKEAK